MRSVLAAGLALVLALGGRADGRKDVTMDKVAYKGWKNNLRLANGSVELIVTLDVGPRVISFRLADGRNVFKEYADQFGKTGEKDWQIRGGHRLWAGPEDLTRTYAPDNGPVEYEELPRKEAGVVGVRFQPAAEAAYHIQKAMDVQLAPGSPRVEVSHHITNLGPERTTLAPWALSVMAPGGVEIIPLPPKRSHPGPPQNARSPKDYANDQVLALWPFFDFKDPRWTFGSKYVTLRQDAKRGPTKIGVAHRMGWVGYLNGGTLFVKRFKYQDGQPYPDGGVNFETFTNEDMLEVESLGPLVTLGQGETVTLVETWELQGGVPDVKDEADIDRHVLSRVAQRGGG
jgi:hypothetical protein